MKLVLSLGSNLGDRLEHLNLAKNKLSLFLNLIEESRVYESKAVDYEAQDDFLNSVLVFNLPSSSPEELMTKILELELELGRQRDIPKGPRTIDIDMLFWGHIRKNSHHLTLPHPRLFERSFIWRPLMELNYFNELKKEFKFTIYEDPNTWVYDQIDP